MVSEASGMLYQHLQPATSRQLRLGAAPAQSSVVVQPSAGGSEVFALTKQYDSKP